MSPQRSNHDQLIEGTLRCLERLPAERITARAIAVEADANLASIGYHFGSKDDLVTAAVIEGLDRWLDEIERMLGGDLRSTTAADRFRRSGVAIEETRQRHTGLAQTFFAAVAKAPHDPRVREQLAAGFRKTRPAVAALFEFGQDEAGLDAAPRTRTVLWPAAPDAARPGARRRRRPDAARPAAALSTHAAMTRMGGFGAHAGHRLS